MKAVFLAAATIAIAMPGNVQARAMTLSQALEEASKDAPSIAARTAQTEAARLTAIASDRLPDPKLEVGIQDFPVTGPNAGSFTRDNFTMLKVGVSQEFPNSAKRRARLGRARADIGAAQAAEVVEARDVKVQAALAWIDLYFAERRLATLKILDDSIDDIQGTVAARLTSGSARPAQALQPQQLKAEVGDRRSDLVAQASKSRAELIRWTGDPAPEVAGAPPDWTIIPALLWANIDALPSLVALDAATARAEADVRLARAEKRPNWEVSTSYGHRDPSYGDLASVAVKIDLPFFSGRRQDPIIAARASGAESARLEREAARRQAIATLQADLADHAMHHDRFMRARDVLVPLAKKRAELDRVGYAANTVDLGTALDSTYELAKVELDALDREATVVRDGIRINLTYGSDR
ncbi:TolC family protein [Sphingomonas sp.]|uniref:TolC family protein n=1 Tax=Sphingomonas sp. TaxID=28214 RepID=UPI00286BF2DA|nr:TolC family protein [Sphingomonas sp.]